MKYLKRFNESWLPSLDKDEVDNILDKKIFSEQDLAYLNNYTNDNKEVIKLLYDLLKLNTEIAEVGSKMNFWFDRSGAPKEFMSKWVDLSKKISEIENKLRFTYKFDDYPDYLRKMEKELGIEFKQSDSISNLDRKDQQKLFKKWDELKANGMKKEDICDYLRKNYKSII